MGRGLPQRLPRRSLHHVISGRSLAAVSSSGAAALKLTKNLEKAQRESARRRKIDRGKIQGVKFPGSKVTWPELICIAYAKRAQST